MRRRVALAAILAAGSLLLLAAIVWVPPLLADTSGVTVAADRLKIVGDLRGTLVTALAGIAVAAGTVIAALTFAETQRQNRETSKLTLGTLTETERQNRVSSELTAATLAETQRQNRETTEVTRRSQVTERFAKAVEQLGSTILDVRLGAIYSLEQIARDSQELQGPIMEILCAFVREHSAKNPPNVTVPERITPATGLPIADLPADLQATITVLGRRNPERDPKGFRVDLHRAYLPGYGFDGGRFAGASFGGAHLSGAGFVGADLRDAYFNRAELVQTYFWSADVTGAQFAWADVTEARFGWPGAVDPAEHDARGLTRDALDLATNHELAVPPSYLPVRGPGYLPPPRP